MYCRQNLLRAFCNYDTFNVSFQLSYFGKGSGKQPVITREADYALRALLRLALLDDGRVLSTTDMAEDMDIPYRFLRRILLRLAGEGFVVSSRGKYGGLRLARPPQEINLYEIVRAMDPDTVILNDCLEDPAFCRRSGRCVVHRELGRIQELLHAQLADVSLATLVQAELQACHIKET